MNGNYCCYCCTAKTGNQTIAIVSLVWCFLNLASGIISSIILFAQSCDSYRSDCNPVTNVTPEQIYGALVLIFTCGYYGYHIYLAFLLLKGIKTNNPHLLQPWISVTSYMFVLSCIATLFMIVALIMAGVPVALTCLFFVIPCLALNFYFIYAVKQYRQLLMRRAQIQGETPTTSVTITSIIPPQSQVRGVFSPPAYETLNNYAGNTELRQPAGATNETLVASDELAIQQKRFEQQTGNLYFNK